MAGDWLLTRKVQSPKAKVFAVAGLFQFLVYVHNGGKKICASTLCSIGSIGRVGGKWLEMRDLQRSVTLTEGGGRVSKGIRESNQKVVSYW